VIFANLAKTVFAKINYNIAKIVIIKKSTALALVRFKLGFFKVYSVFKDGGKGRLVVFIAR